MNIARIFVFAIGLACIPRATYLFGVEQPATAAGTPNFVLILSDDQGWNGTSVQMDPATAESKSDFYQTPNLEKLAAQGMRFSNAYASSPVCSPTRYSLQTGQTTARHGWTKAAPVMTAADNYRMIPPQIPRQFPASETTVAELLKTAGYTTGIVGKWGLGEPDTTGLPRRQGFDSWFGYLNQRHAHNYYPEYLWRNEERVALPGNVVPNADRVGAGMATERGSYSHDLFTREALDFVEKHRDRLACDYVVISDTAKHSADTPALTRSTRGLVYKEIAIQGPSHDLHSGSYGGMVANPANALASIIASLHDDHRRVTIPGFYDDVEALSDEERRGLASLGPSDADLLAATGSPATAYSVRSFPPWPTGRWWSSTWRRSTGWAAGGRGRPRREPGPSRSSQATSS